MKNKLLLILDKLDIELGDIKDTGYYIRRNLLKLMKRDDTLICKREDILDIPSIPDITYFPYCNRYDDILEVLDNLNVNLAYTKKNIESCINWFLYIEKRYRKRRFDIVSKKNLFNEINTYIINDKVFIKSVNKGRYSRVYNLKSQYSISYLKQFLDTLQDDDLLFVSQPVEMKKDELGYVEYRCLMTNTGKVSSISRRTYENYEEIDVSEIIKFAEKMYKPNFSYCSIDIGIDKDGDLFIVEANPIIASGIYYNNDLIKLIND